MANKKYASLSSLTILVDTIKEKFSQIGHKHTVADIEDISTNYETKTDASLKLTESKAYTDTKISTFLAENLVTTEATLNSEGVLCFTSDIIQNGDEVSY